MSKPIVYLMRGLPSCGKSHAATRLAGERGVVLETDQYFYTQVGDDPKHYDYDKNLLETARQWNFDQFITAIEQGTSSIVIDRGNGRNPETQQYAHYAVKHGYRVELAEPDSPWWQEIRVLLKYKKITQPILYQWADRLAVMSESTHRVPASTIRRWMDGWKWDLTIEQILEHRA